MRRTLILLSLLLLAAPARASELQVHAAASLTDVLAEIGAIYQRRTGVVVRFNFAGSSTIAWQIEQHVPGDLFVSADEARMDELDRRGLIARETRRSLLSNALVVVVPHDNTIPIRTLADLTRPAVERIAIGNPQTVPAGIYAKKALTAAGVWPRVTAKLVPTENVRATLAAVEAGNVEAGIVYRTDAMSSHRVKVAFAIGGTVAPSISYPAAVLRESEHKLEARRFLEFLSSSDARRVFLRRGFLVR